MAKEGIELAESKTTTELQPANGKVNNRCPVCGMDSPQYTAFLDSLGIAVIEAIRRALQEGAGVVSANTWGGVDRGQPAIKSAIQRKPDRVITRYRENN